MDQIKKIINNCVYSNSIKLDLLIIFIFAILPYSKLLSPGYIIKIDLEFPLDLWQKAFRDYYIWDNWIDLGREIIGWCPHLWWALNLFRILGLSIEAIEKGFFIFVLSFTGYGAYFLCRHLTKGNRLASIIAALFYMFNPWLLDRILFGHFSIQMGYMLIPWVLLFFIKSLELKRIKYQIITGLFFSLQVMMEIYVAYATFLLLVAYFVVQLIIGSEERRRVLFVLDGLRIFFLVFIITILINMHWILPTLYIKSENIFLSSPQRMWIEDVYGYSDYNFILNLLRLRYFRFSHFLNIEKGLLNNSLYSIFTFLPSAISFSAIFFYRYNKYIFFFISLNLVFLCFALGTNLPFKLYERLWYNIPGFMAFRNPNTWLVIVCLSYAILISIMTDIILSIKRK